MCSLTQLEIFESIQRFNLKAVTLFKSQHSVSVERLCPKTWTLSTHQCDPTVCPQQPAVFINLPTVISKVTINLYGHVSPPVKCVHSLVTACCMTGVCMCVCSFHLPTVSPFFFLSDPAQLQLTKAVVCTMFWVVSVCRQMEDEDAGRKSKQQNGGVCEDSKHKKVERTQR